MNRMWMLSRHVKCFNSFLLPIRNRKLVSVLIIYTTELHRKNVLLNMLTHTNSLPHALYNHGTGSAGGFDIESENRDKKGVISITNPSCRGYLVLSLSESALLTQLLIFCLRRREVLMSYFIALFREVSPC